MRRRRNGIRVRAVRNQRHPVHHAGVPVPSLAHGQRRAGLHQRLPVRPRPVRRGRKLAAHQHQPFFRDQPGRRLPADFSARGLPGPVPRRNRIPGKLPAGALRLLFLPGAYAIAVGSWRMGPVLAVHRVPVVDTGIYSNGWHAVRLRQSCRRIRHQFHPRFPGGRVNPAYRERQENVPGFSPVACPCRKLAVARAPMDGQQWQGDRSRPGPGRHPTGNKMVAGVQEPVPGRLSRTDGTVLGP